MKTTDARWAELKSYKPLSDLEDAAMMAEAKEQAVSLKGGKLSARLDAAMIVYRKRMQSTGPGGPEAAPKDLDNLFRSMISGSSPDDLLV